VVTLALPHQRRTMERLTREAGVDLTAVKVAPGHELLAATGASAPSGIAVPEERIRRVLEGEKRGRRPGGPGSRPGGPRGARTARPERGYARSGPSRRAPRD
jgi:hypothetical protein